MKKKILIVLTTVMVVTLLTAFTDVPKSHWAYSELNNAQNLGLVNGVGDNKYEPDRSISKQEIAKMLYNAYAIFGSAEDITEDYSEEFAGQIEASKIADWASAPLAYGFKYDFWTATEFKDGATAVPGRDLIAQWTYRVLNCKKDFGLRILGYADNDDIKPEYYEAVDALWKYGIMRGNEAGCFLPDKPFTRVEAGVIGARMVDKLNAKVKAFEEEPFVYEGGVMTEYNAKTQSFKIGEKLFNIAEGASIMLDGKQVSFSDLEALNEKSIVLSQYLGGDNTMSLLLQTAPKLLGGTVESVSSHTTGVFKSKPHDVVTINVDGISIDFVKNKDTDVLKSISAGNTVQFIADGIYLLEIR